MLADLTICVQNFYNVFTAFWTKKVKNFQKTKASHFGPSVYHYKLLKGKPTELERLMEAEVTN